MFQQHGLDANGKLLRRFYEPLVLLSSLDPTRGAQYPNPILDRGWNDRKKLWHDFLDRISYLCDFDKGGDTVTAVAAEMTVEGPVFWVASNSNSRYQAVELLEWLFDKLQHVCATNPTSTTILEDEINARCIKLSSSRIKDYTKLLSAAITRVRDDIGGRASAEDNVILSELEQIDSLQNDSKRLCAYAYQMRTRTLMKVLHQRHNGQSQRNSWSDLRHYIGRLGSWTKAIRTLIHGAKTFPQCIENATVKPVEPQKLIDLPNKKHTSGLESVVNRMLSPEQSSIGNDLIQALRDTDAIFNIENEFRNKYAKMKPRPHAELLVLEHFHHHRTEFVNDDRYIGCSKRSCYCCHLYMQCHPGRFEPRPSHGNLWINWAPPCPLPINTQKKSQKPPAQRPQEHHSFKMLQEMVAHIRRDLQEQIMSRRPRRDRHPDSTTGISSVLFDMDVAIFHDTPAGAGGAVPDEFMIDTSDFSMEVHGDDENNAGSDADDRSSEADSGSEHPMQVDTPTTRSKGSILSAGSKDKECASATEVESEDDEDGGVMLFKGRTFR